MAGEEHRVPFALQLQQLRTSARLTQEGLAEVSGIAARTISDLERGISLAPHTATVRRLADALGLTGPARASFEAAGRQSAMIGGPAAGRRSAPTRTLPRDISSFTGREAELGQLLSAAEPAGQGGVVGIYVIEGMAGVGKTSLALRAAHELSGQFPDGQLFLDLRGYTDGLEPLSAGAALGSLLRSLGTPDQLIPVETEERAAFYRSRLAGTRTLIILDNALSTAQVRPLLPGTAGCLVIVTSRRSLWDLDDAEVIALDPPPAQEAIELLRAVAGAGRVPARDPAAARIVALCGCLPLAVRIVAARVRRRSAMALADVVDELRDERSRLASLRNEDRDLAAVFASSYRHLADAEQRMFADLGLIPGPDFEVAAATSLTGTDPGVAGALLDSLADHNLLLQPAAGRYRFHDLVRVYARTLSSEPGADTPPGSTPAPGGDPAAPGSTSAGAALDRLLDFYLYSAQAADRHFERRIPRAGQLVAVNEPPARPRLDTPERARAWIAAELTNLDAAAHYAARRDRPAHAVALSAALAQYLRAHGPWTDAIELHQMAASAAQDAGEISGQAGALRYLGVIQRQRGTLRHAEETLTQALKLYVQLGDRHGEAGALAELGVAQRLMGAHAAAEDGLTRALEIYSEHDDHQGQAGALSELAIAQRQRGAFAEAEANLATALALYRELGNRYGEAGTLTYLGSVQWAAGALESASAALSQGLKLGSELGDIIGQANSFLYLGCVHREAGAYPEATAALTQALDIYAQLGDRRSEAGALAYLGAVQTLTGEYRQAGESLAQAISLFRELHDRGGEAETLNYHAALAAAIGSAGEALARYAGALRLAREISSPKDEADALAGMAAAYRAEGDVGEARSHFRQAGALYQAHGCTADADRVAAALEALRDS